MTNIKVSNIVNPNNYNKISNQFVINTNDAEIFQSYNSIICKITGNKVYLDANYWNYSRTTSRWRNVFLNESTQETKKKIKDGVYTLTDLNA